MQNILCNLDSNYWLCKDENTVEINVVGAKYSFRKINDKILKFITLLAISRSIQVRNLWILLSEF